MDLRVEAKWRRAKGATAAAGRQRSERMEGIRKLNGQETMETLCTCRRSYPGDFRVFVQGGGAQFAMVAGGNVVAADVEEIGNRLLDGCVANVESI